MKKSYLIAGIIVLILVVGVAGFFMLRPKKSVAPEPLTNYENLVPTAQATPTPKPTENGTTGASHSLYSQEFRAQARVDFINRCVQRAGSQYTAACTCTVNKLEAGYTDEELTKMFVSYMRSSTTPAEVTKAYDSCK